MSENSSVLPVDQFGRRLPIYAINNDTVGHVRYLAENDPNGSALDLPIAGWTAGPHNTRLINFGTRVRGPPRPSRNATGVACRKSGEVTKISQHFEATDFNNGMEHDHTVDSSIVANGLSVAPPTFGAVTQQLATRIFDGPCCRVWKIPRLVCSKMVQAIATNRRFKLTLTIG